VYCILKEFTMRKTPLITALMLSAASPALALDFGSGFYATGEFELEYIDGSGFSGETFGYGKADIGYEQEGGGFGGFVGFDAFAFDDQQESAFYGALTYSGSFGKIQVGAPRNALDDYIGTPDLGGSSLFDLQLSQAKGSIIPILYLGSNIDTPVGLRYDGSFGAAKVGISYHSIDTLDIVDIGVNYQIGQVSLRAGAEQGSDGGFSDTSYFIGAEGEIGPVVAGLMYGDLGIIGNASTVQVYATYSPIEALDLTATYMSLDSGGPILDIYGIAAKYTVYQGVYVEGGYLDGDNFTGDLFSASLGVKF
jgi:hypothetical protein